MKHVVITGSPEETYKLGYDFGRLLKKPYTILLLGGMGAGKTAMTKAIVAGMKIEEDVSSPTYTLVNEYRGTDFSVFHFDLYRIGDAEELYEMGFEDYLNDGDTLIIEWPQIAEEYPFESKILVDIKQNAALYKREIVIETEDDALIKGLKELGW
ncbi:MAG: tRNA (adenosine(37)-N6)-threonylcarbamoyltransferase complex ATPase subunit type 1 TsaE [Eubacterium sp.]